RGSYRRSWRKLSVDDVLVLAQRDNDVLAGRVARVHFLDLGLVARVRHDIVDAPTRAGHDVLYGHVLDHGVGFAGDATVTRAATSGLTWRNACSLATGSPLAIASASFFAAATAASCAARRLRKFGNMAASSASLS